MKQKLSEHFYWHEFKCPCGKCESKPEDIAKDLLINLEDLRTIIDEPIVVTSGLRCKEYNQKVGGSPKSKHLSGLAADISVKHLTPVQIAYAAWLCGFRRIGVYPCHVHIDVAEGEYYWGGVYK